MTTRLMSPRRTLPNQTLDCSPISVSPMTRAVSARNTPTPICGRFPRYSRTLATKRILAMRVAKCKAVLAEFPPYQMTKAKPTPPNWIFARLGDDGNWWVAESSQDIYWGEGMRGLLDPRQIAHITEILDEYQPFGFRRHLLD